MYPERLTALRVYAPGDVVGGALGALMLLRRLHKHEQLSAATKTHIVMHRRARSIHKNKLGNLRMYAD